MLREEGGQLVSYHSTKKPAMPKTYAKLPPADVDSLVAYMQSLK